MFKGYAVKIGEKCFEDVVSKQAYLNACKWLATNVYCSEDYSHNISVRVLKQPHEKSDETFKFVVELYYITDFESVQKIFCNNCKLSVNTFFGNEPLCNACRFNPFLKKLEHDTETIVKNLKNAFGVTDD